MTVPADIQEPIKRDEKFIAFCGSFSRGAAALVFLVGFFALLGWLFDIRIFLWTSPGRVVMKPNAAFSFVLCGISLWLLERERQGPLSRIIAGACALLAALVGFLTLGEYAFGWNVGIDQLLAREAPGALKTSSPGRMAPNAAFNFALLGTSLVLLGLRRGHIVASILSGVACSVAVLALMGYSYVAESSAGFASYTHIAFQTAAAFVALSTGVLLVMKDRGLIGVFSRDGAGSVLARRMLPAVLLVPLLFGWVRYEGYRQGLISDEFGVALMVVSSVVALVILVWHSAVVINRSDLERKQVEKKRKRQERELARTTEILEKIFSSIHFSVVFLDPRFNFIRVNQTYADACGYPAESFIGKNHFDLYPHAENEAIFRKVVETGAPFTVFAKPFEFPDHPERGVTYWDWSLHPVKDETGKVSGLLFTLVDVTERVRAEGRLKESEQAALRQERMAILGQMAAGIAHEIRNPLSGLNVYIATAETILDEIEFRKSETRETVKHALSAARSASGKIEGVIRRVMDFARPTRTVLGLVQVNEAVREAVALVSVTLRNSGIRLETRLSQDLPFCNADSRLVEQLLLNLVTNAAQAMEGQDGEKRIEISTGTEDGAVVIRVNDTGPGVPESIRERIFEPFFTTKSGGTGLGLSISNQIVSDHGGSIRVGKGRFGGAEFRVCIPAGAERR